MRRGEYKANLHIAPASLRGRALKEKYFKKPLKPVDYHIRTYIYINLYLFRHKAILNRKIHVFINYKLLLVVAIFFQDILPQTAYHRLPLKRNTL